MATTRYETALTILNDAAVELGLETSTDPFSSSDPEMTRLVRLLISAGRELVEVHRWPHLVKTNTITVATSDGRIYALPADYSGLVVGTVWNTTRDDKLIGPIDPETWAYLEAHAETSSPAKFRIFGDYLRLLNTADATDGDVITYEYRSKSWVMASGANPAVPGDDRVTATTDTVWFPPLLIKIALKRAWMQAASMDTSAIESAYWQAIDRAKSTETLAAPMCITPYRQADPLAPSQADRFTL